MGLAHVSDVTSCRTRKYASSRQVLEVNTVGVLFTAQAAGRQMARFGNGGSIILIGSMSGSITNKVSGADPNAGLTEHVVL